MIIILILWTICLAFLLAFWSFCKAQAENYAPSPFENRFSPAYYSVPIIAIISTLGFVIFWEPYLNDINSRVPTIVHILLHVFSVIFTAYFMQHVNCKPTGMNKYSKMHMPAPVVAPLPDGDPDFSDDELDALIKAGRFSEARKILSDLTGIARQLRDMKLLGNYHKYELRLVQATLDGKIHARCG